MIATSGFAIARVALINIIVTAVVLWLVRGVWRCNRDMRPKRPPALPGGTHHQVHPSG